MNPFANSVARWSPWLLALLCAGCGGSDGLNTVGHYERNGVTVHLEAGDTSIDITGRVELRLRVTAPPDHEVLLPGVEANFGDFTLFDFQAFEPAVEADGSLTWEERYVLEPFLAGDYEVPRLAIRFRDGANGRLNRVQCVPVPVSVASLFPEGGETPELQDIAPIAAWPGRRWHWAAPLLALTACILLAVAMFVQKRKRPQAAVPVRGPAPHEIAWAELEALLAEGFHKRREWDPFYTRLTGILRRYIDGRFAIRAPKLTSRELISRVQEGETLEAQDRKLLEEFLSLGDLVKFARRAPGANGANASVDQFKTFLRDTTGAGSGRRG